MSDSSNLIYPLKHPPLAHYSVKDAAIFFGREKESERLGELCRQSDLVVVYGTSGSGKTSLIECGLATQFSPYDWFPVYLRRGVNSWSDGLLQQLKKKTTHCPAVAEEDNQLTDKASEVAKALQQLYQDRLVPIYLIFDQFEELFTLGDNQEYHDLIQQVDEILNLPFPVKVIISIREEYLGPLYVWEQKHPGVLHHRLRIGRMDQLLVERILKGIFQDNTLIDLEGFEKENFEGKEKNINQFTAALYDKISKSNSSPSNTEVHIPISLPYLQVYLNRLYFLRVEDKQHQDKVTFSIESLNRLGSLDKVLDNFLQEQVKEIAKSPQLKEKNKISEETVWGYLKFFITEKGTKRPHTAQELEEKFNEIKESFLRKELEDRFVIRVREDDGQYELYHDTLALCLVDRLSQQERLILQAQRVVEAKFSVEKTHRRPLDRIELNLTKGVKDGANFSEEQKEYITWSRKFNQRRRVTIITITSIFVAILNITTIYITKIDSEKRIADFTRKIIEDNTLETSMRLAEFYDNKLEYNRTIDSLLSQRTLLSEMINQTEINKEQQIKKLEEIIDKYETQLAGTYELLARIQLDNANLKRDSTSIKDSLVAYLDTIGDFKVKLADAIIHKKTISELDSVKTLIEYENGFLQNRVRLLIIINKLFEATFRQEGQYHLAFQSENGFFFISKEKDTLNDKFYEAAEPFNEVNFAKVEYDDQLYWLDQDGSEYPVVTSLNGLGERPSVIDLSNSKDTLQLNAYSNFVLPILILEGVPLSSSMVSSLSPIWNGPLYLNLSHTNLQTIPITADWSELRSLDLSHTPVKFIPPSIIRNMQQLKYLNLRGTQIPEDRIASIKLELPNPDCEVIY